MIIAHNMLANMTNRQLGINNKNSAKITARLSSGYKINIAADDAACLSISEKMRGQIRGLLRGSINVLEGQDMIDTAEGAITEQVNVLQRMRELTVQAYNDTYTQKDRLDIQLEVDALSAEIDRIAADTEYNTIKVLQGPKINTHEVEIKPSEEFSDTYFSMYSEQKFPAWVTLSDNQYLTLNTPTVSPSLKQDVTGVTYKVDKDSDPNNIIVTVQGGTRAARDKFKKSNSMYKTDCDLLLQEAKGNGKSLKIVDGGDWTDGLNDNYTATLDFSALANCTSADEICEKLNELVGRGVDFECGTCKLGKYGGITEGFVFESDNTRVTKVYNSNQHMKKINLQSCYDIVGNMYSKADFDKIKSDPGYVSAEAAQIFSGTYESYVKKVSGQVANDLMNKILVDNGGEEAFSNHYLRVTGDRSKYQIILYDYRDESFVGSNVKPQINLSVPLELATKVQVKNQSIWLTAYEENGYWIQVAANARQGLFIDFPDTSLAGMDLLDYTVFRKGYCSVTEDEYWNPTMMDGATETSPNHYTKHLGGECIETTETLTRQELEYQYTYATKMVERKEIVRRMNNKGEIYNDTITKYVPQTVLVIDGNQPPTVKNITQTIVHREYKGGKDVDFVAYGPDSILRIDRALKKLSTDRSYLGAMHNRLAHAYLNDRNTAENLQSAESKIRDMDMAEGLMEQAKISILQQAGTAMLAQVNSMNDGVLTLLNR